MNFIQKSPFFRKGLAVARKLPRIIAKIKASPDDYQANPPVLCNSFPKSGTHLLKQVLSVLPDIINYGSFIATQPTLALSKLPVSKLSRKMNKITPGELICSHLEFYDDFSPILRQKNIVHYFIYRDIRDVVVSETYYLTYMNKWHRLHKYYQNIPDMEGRNSLCILGGKKSEGLPYDYQNIGDRYRSYIGWITSDFCFPIRFEDLVGDKQEETVRRIIAYYLQQSNKKADLDLLVSASMKAIRPQKSHTFRKGKTGTWKDALTDTQLQEINRLAGDELRILGYNE